uniref:Uncharacterized protein n=1 Tax=Meloidogyne enterolobii TaxID=390850 RepID=A0A6V7WAY4_MELEN|nr:unnamed protein product [Meloidogyne enterolobii]
MLITLTYFIEIIYVTRRKGKQIEVDTPKEDDSILNDKKIEELFDYNQLSKNDQIKQDKLFDDLQTELNRLLNYLNDSDELDDAQNNVEYFNEFKEFIYEQNKSFIDNLNNPEIKEKIKGLNTKGIERLDDLKNMVIDSDYLIINDSKYYNKYNRIDFVCPEGESFEKLTNNEPEPIGYELIPTKETINNYIEFLSKNNQQNEASTSSTSQPLVDIYKINISAIISRFINLIVKILNEDLEKFEDENKRLELIKDWNNVVGNVSLKTIYDMESKLCRIFLFLEKMVSLGWLFC